MATSGKTSLIRLHEEQADKLRWICRLKNIVTAEFIGPLIQKELDAEYDSILPMVERLKELESVKAAKSAPALAASEGT